MSSIPGLTLEAFLMWNYGLIVGGDTSANPSLEIAEALGHIARRKELTREQFAPILAVFEPYREQTERVLWGYDEEENGSVFARGETLVLAS